MSGPHTDALAYPIDHIYTASPQRLITVTNANIRLATVSGTFLVYDKYNQSPYPFRGHTVVDVDCSWYQWRPNRDCIRLILNNNETIRLEQRTKIQCIWDIGR
jgi:hypothetical protein